METSKQTATAWPTGHRVFKPIDTAGTKPRGSTQASRLGRANNFDDPRLWGRLQSTMTSGALCDPEGAKVQALAALLAWSRSARPAAAGSNSISD